MSLIGPRPLYPFYLPYYTEKESLRHSVRGGITGLAQVNGRALLRWNDRFEKDIEYISNITFWGDIKILWMGMEIKGTEMDSIEKYLELSRTCTELFAQSEELPLVLDPKELYAFAQKSGRRIGIVYESHYHLMVVDVVRAKNGSLFAYERLMNRVMRGAVVIVPYYNGKYILLRQYRHALREYQYGFPRGFGEEGISAKENAGKELWEELGVQAEKWKSFGKIVPDSGAMSSKADVFLAELNEAPQVIQEEEIVGHIALDWEQLGEWIRDGKITDGFTLAAYAKMSLQK